MNKIQRTTTKGIVYKDGKVFMVKDERSNWELPGGRIDFGEQPEEALRREFLEELEVEDVKVRDIIHTWAFESEKDGEKYHFILLFFECDADLSKVNISNEHQEYKWVNLNEIDQYQMRDGYRKVIKKYLKARIKLDK